MVRVGDKDRPAVIAHRRAIAPRVRRGALALVRHHAQARAEAGPVRRPILNHVLLANVELARYDARADAEQSDGYDTPGGVPVRNHRRLYDHLGGTWLYH